MNKTTYKIATLTCRYSRNSLALLNSLLRYSGAIKTLVTYKHSVTVPDNYKLFNVICIERGFNGEYRGFINKYKID